MAATIGDAATVDRMRDTLLIIHILAAAAWFGTNMVQVAINPGIHKRDAAIASHWHTTTASLARVVYMPASMVSLLTGILLLVAVDDSPYEFSDMFVSIGFAMIIVGAGMGMGFFAPTARKAAAAYDNGDTQGAAQLEKKIAMGGMLDTTLMVLTVAAMVGKWGV
jgi:uncharacterized membrane protein